MTDHHAAVPLLTRLQAAWAAANAVDHLPSNIIAALQAIANGAALVVPAPQANEGLVQRAKDALIRAKKIIGPHSLCADALGYAMIEAAIAELAAATGEGK